MSHSCGPIWVLELTPIRRYSSNVVLRLWLGHLWRGVEKGGNARWATDLAYIIEIKILRKLRYCTLKKYHTDHTDDTFIVLSTVYQQFLFLRAILAASVDVSTMKSIFASCFLQPISLENLRNLLIRFRRFIFYSATILYLEYFATYLLVKQYY